MVNAQYYPGANPDEQNFLKAYPKLFAGRWMSGVNTLVLHTTEGSSWPGYSDGTMCPTFTYDPVGHHMRQHIPANMGARALVDLAGGVTTDRLNCAQIEIIGYAKDGGPLDAQAIAELGALVAWLNAEWRMPIIAPYSFNVPAHRMSFAEWNGFKGICGHCHVPENIHWDPGNMNVDAIMDSANDIIGVVKQVLEVNMQYPIFVQTTGEKDPEGKIDPWIPTYMITPGKPMHHVTPDEWKLLARLGAATTGGQYWRAEVDIINALIQPDPTPATLSPTDLQTIAQAVADILGKEVADDVVADIGKHMVAPTT